MKQMTELVVKNNDEILEQFFKDFRSILYTRRPLKVQLKMMYAAYNAATYFMGINNGIIKRKLKE